MTLTDYRSRFIDGLGFGLDPFQSEAIEAIDQHVNVLVSAPTGSARRSSRTTPSAASWSAASEPSTPRRSSALQSEVPRAQRALRRAAGRTADRRHPHNRDAEIIVMTTEVLRNMLLTESHQLVTLGLVVLDEVHYLQDPFRGGVWEEVIILTPRPCGSWRCRPRSATPPSWGSGSARCAVPPASLSKRIARSSFTIIWRS